MYTDSDSQELDPKDPAEIIPITWLFNDPALTVSAVTATVSVYDGIDPSPSSLLGATSYSNNAATVIVQGGVHGVIYKIKVQITLTGGTRYVYTALLPVLNL